MKGLDSDGLEWLRLDCAQGWVLVGETLVGRLVRDLLEDLLGSSQNAQFLDLCIYPCCSASIEDDVDRRRSV